MIEFLKKKKALVFLLIIMGIAAFFRLWQLDSIPPGLYPDVAMNGNNALETLKTGDFKVFYTDNNGREGLMMWLIALSFQIFGVSIWSIKIVAAIAGILTVLGLYLLVKELLVKYSEKCSRYIALLASFFLATSFWHTLFSRIGFRAILLPLVSVFAFYFLLKGFNAFQKQYYRPFYSTVFLFILAGLLFGLGFYTYTSFRMIILLIPLLLFCLWYLRKNKKIIIATGCFLLTAIIVALPLGIYFLQQPQDFMSRMTGVSIFAQENPVRAFGESLIKHLGMFNVSGDYNWRHNFAGSPMLPWPVGVLFALGFIFSIKNLIVSIKTKNHSLAMAPIFLLFWFFSMLLPGVLTSEGTPHALRVLGAIPAVYIFAGLGGYWIYNLISLKIRRRRTFFVFCFLFFVLIGASEFNKYFFKWGLDPNVKKAFTRELTEIGYFLNSLPKDTQKYVIVNEIGSPLYGISIPGQTPMFISPSSTYLRVEDLDKIKITPRKTIIVPIYEKNIFEILQIKFPGGKIIKENNFSYYAI